MKFVVLYSYLFYIGFSLHHRAPVLDLQSGTDVYYGTAKETDTVVKISTEIRIVDGTGPVCSYVVETLNGPLNGSEKLNTVPFTVDVEDRQTGRAVVRLKTDATLDCTDDVYRFKIFAKRCEDASLSDGAVVEVRVEDVNNHEPTFAQNSYAVDVDEGRLYDRILQLQATDDDCGQYGEICRYEITNNAKSFEITPSGILKNTQPLNWTVSHTHLISVVAHDCGMHVSKPTLITVKVNEVCIDGLSGHYVKLDYNPGSGALPLMPDVAVRFCDPQDCEPTSFESKISLNVDSSINGRPCDRESLSVERQQKICGADSSTVELLPNSKSVKIENSKIPSKMSSSSEESDSNEVSPASDDVYVFDGRNNAVIVPSSIIQPIIPESFTLSFWMKHGKPKKIEDHHSKENIFCSSDDHRMNRHHFAVYVRNCKLEILFRHEATKDAADSTFTPAEWRWKLPEACDGRWHHYSFNVKFPQIDLLVDGRTEPNKGDSPEILDDWPMHSMKDLKTRFVVGACWHGGANKMAQYFQGYLSGVTMLPGKLEKQSVLQCLLQCKEQLEFFGLDKLRPGEEAIFNNDMSELTLKASKREDFVELLRKVSYLNSRSSPTIGERTIAVETSVECKGQSAALNLPTIESEIYVTKFVDVSKISLKGSILLRHKQNEVELGVNIFPDLKLNLDGKQNSQKSEFKLNFCKIKTKPALDKQREYFTSSASLVGELGLEFEHISDGLILKGVETMKNYEKALEQIKYFNSRPENFAKRIFYVDCASGTIGSQEFIVTLSIDPADHELHQPSSDVVEESKSPANQSIGQAPKVAAVQPIEDVVASSTKGPAIVVPAAAFHQEETENDNHLAVNKMDAFAPQPKIGSAALPLAHQSGYENFGPSSQTGPGGAIAIVVVVCVGFLLLLIVVGILKVRSTHRRLMKSRRPTEDGDLAWDDSGMNIIVNPIEVVPEPAKVHEDDYSEGSSDDESYRDDEDCSEDDEEEVLPHVETTNGHGSTGLEWDDSTLHHPAVHNPRTHTYRV